MNGENLSPKSNPKYYELKKGSVYDGDTFWVINANTGEKTKIRLACIDAPEKKQELGITSRDYLRSLLNTNPEKLVVMKKEKDRYGRMVAEVFIGLCRHNWKFSKQTEL